MSSCERAYIWQRVSKLSRLQPRGSGSVLGGATAPGRGKDRIVGETSAPGAKVSAIARSHGLDPSQLLAWRRKALASGMVAPVSGATVRVVKLARFESVPSEMMEVVIGDVVMWWCASVDMWRRSGLLRRSGRSGRHDTGGCADLRDQHATSCKDPIPSGTRWTHACHSRSTRASRALN
jgi:transposase